MEAVARQFGTNKKVFVLRNGYFSYRWSEIIEVGQITTDETVLKAEFDASETNPQLKPHDIEKVVALIGTHKPAVVFAPQIETSTGIILPKEYIKAVQSSHFLFPCHLMLSFLFGRLLAQFTPMEDSLSWTASLLGPCGRWLQTSLRCS